MFSHILCGAALILPRPGAPCYRQDVRSNTPPKPSMSVAPTHLLGLLPVLAGCIWISKEDYVEAMGCDPELAVDSADLAIRGDIDDTGLDDVGGGSLVGDDAMALGRDVVTLDDLDGNNGVRWAVGGQSALLLGYGNPPTSRYALATAEESRWHSVANLPSSAQTLYVGAAEAGDLGGNGERDLLVYTTTADPTDASGLAVYLLSGEETNWENPSLPDDPILQGALGDQVRAFDMLRLVAFSEPADGGDDGGDGFTGLLMAASETDGCVGTARGAVYFFEGDQLQKGVIGSESWSATAGQTYYEDGTTTSHLGCATVARAGDVDGSGKTDALLGTPGYYDMGRAFLIPGESLAEKHALTLSALDVVWQDQEGDTSLVGYAVSGAGDVDGDGYDDVLVGTHEQGGGGEARLLRGGNMGIDDDLWVKFIPEEGKEITDLGREVAGGGDLDSDSMCTPDVVISGTDKDGHQARWVFLGAELQGESAVTTEAARAVLLHGAVWPNEGPLTLAQLADLNGDGYADILSGAPSVDADAGEAWFLFGGPASP